MRIKKSTYHLFYFFLNMSLTFAIHQKNQKIPKKSSYSMFLYTNYYEHNILFSILLLIYFKRKMLKLLLDVFVNFHFPILPYTVLSYYLGNCRTLQLVEILKNTSIFKILKHKQYSIKICFFFPETCNFSCIFQKNRCCMQIINV